MKQFVVVVVRRQHRHPVRERVNRVVRRGRVRWGDDPGGVGSQIVREQRVCPDCHERERTRASR